MRPPRWIISALLAGIVALPAAAGARALSVMVSTDRGANAVYQPGDRIEIKARTSDDAYLLVYEIDAEGYVHLLFPRPGESDQVEGGQTWRIPEDDSDVDLVVQGPTGQGYIVALAATTPFGDLPWYLRPHDAQAEAMGYEGAPEQNDDTGVTAEGRIVGDPFVAMEHIRRRVLTDPNDLESFASSYTSYFVEHEVRYPRYLCYDCHRPGYWNWWDGFDPYYAQCSVFDFRVNWGWYWGPRYWCGSVPYFVFVYRNDCPPHYRRYQRPGHYYSSWDGWQRWRTLWGPRLTRFKSAPPAGYVPPNKFTDKGGRYYRGGDRQPPGYLAGGQDRARVRGGGTTPVRRNYGGRETGSDPRASWRDRRDAGRDRRLRDPGRDIGEPRQWRTGGDAPRVGVPRTPRFDPGRVRDPSQYLRPGRDLRRAAPEPIGDGRRWRLERPAPAPQPVREIRPEPRNDPPRESGGPREQVRVPSREDHRPTPSPDAGRGERRRWR